MRTEEKSKLLNGLPEHICGNTAKLCGQRGKNKLCRCPQCWCCVSTKGLNDQDLELLAHYSKKF